ncbi:hypothetical protein DXG01_008904, partial [Tephrocybe rancida]
DHNKAIMNSTDNSGSNSGPRLGSTPNLCPPRSRVDAPHAFGADGTTPQVLHTFQNAVLEIGPNTTEESLSLDDATWTLLIDALKSESEPTADIEHKAPRAEFPSSISFRLFTSVNRTHERSHIDIHGPFDQVAPTAIQLSMIKPANTAISPTAIIDDVKARFCPPTTIAPPLEEVPPGSTSGPLPISADLTNSGIVLKAPLALEHHGRTVKTSMDDPGFDFRPQLLSTPNFYPPGPRIDAPHTCCAEDAIPHDMPLSQSLDFDSNSLAVPVIASDRSITLKIVIDTATEGIEKVQATMEIGIGDAPMNPAAAKYRFMDIDGVDSLLEANDTPLHIQTLLVTGNTSPCDELWPREVASTTLPIESLTAETLAQQDVDIDPPPPYSFDDPPGALTDRHAEEVRTFDGINPCTAITQAQDTKAFLGPTANRQLSFKSQQ